MPPAAIFSTKSKAKDTKDSLLDELKMFTGARRKQVDKESRRRSRSNCSRKEEKQAKEPEVIRNVGVLEMENIPDDGLADVVLPKEPPLSPGAAASESIVDKIKNSLKRSDGQGGHEVNAEDKSGLVWGVVTETRAEQPTRSKEEEEQSAAKRTNPLPPPAKSPPANRAGKSDRQALDEGGSRLLASLTHGCFSDDLRKSAADLVSLSRG